MKATFNNNSFIRTNTQVDLIQNTQQKIQIVHCVNKLFFAFIKKKVSVFIKTSSCTLLHGIKKFPQQTNFSSALFPKFKVQFCIKEKRWDETRLTWWPPPEPAPGRRACCWQSWSPSGGRGRRWPPVTCWTLSPPSHPCLWVPMGENYVIKIFTKHHFKIY